MVEVLPRPSDVAIEETVWTSGGLLVFAYADDGVYAIVLLPPGPPVTETMRVPLAAELSAAQWTPWSLQSRSAWPSPLMSGVVTGWAHQESRLGAATNVPFPRPNAMYW